MKIIQLFLLTISSNVLTAQTWSFGPELGINHIKLEEGYAGNQYTSGIHVGAFTEYGFNEFFSVRTGLYFSQKKQNYNREAVSFSPIFELIGGAGLEQFDLSTTTITNGRLAQNFIELPILAKVNYKGLGLFAGVYGSLMVSAVSKEVSTANTPILSIIDPSTFGFLGALIPPATVVTEDTDESPTGIKSFDFGARFGASYRFDRLELNLAYSLGLIEYRTNSDNGPNRQHRYFQATLAYNFGTNPGNDNFWQTKKLK